MIFGKKILLVNQYPLNDVFSCLENLIGGIFELEELSFYANFLETSSFDFSLSFKDYALILCFSESIWPICEKIKNSSACPALILVDPTNPDIFPLRRLYDKTLKTDKSEIFRQYEERLETNLRTNLFKEKNKHANYLKSYILYILNLLSKQDKELAHTLSFCKGTILSNHLPIHDLFHHNIHLPWHGWPGFSVLSTLNKFHFPLTHEDSREISRAIFTELCHGKNSLQVL